MCSECAGFARDPAKVEDQVRFLARTLSKRRRRRTALRLTCKAKAETLFTAGDSLPDLRSGGLLTPLELGPRGSRVRGSGRQA